MGAVERHLGPHLLLLRNGVGPPLLGLDGEDLADWDEQALRERIVNVPVIGVIEPGARAGVAATKNKRIAVLATEGTVKGGAYARAIKRLMADAEVIQQPCQVFVALAEEGWAETPATLAVAQHYLGALFAGKDAADTLLLELRIGAGGHR